MTEETAAAALICVKWAKFRIFLRQTMFLTWPYNKINPLGLKLLGGQSTRLALPILG